MIAFGTDKVEFNKEFYNKTFSFYLRLWINFLRVLGQLGISNHLFKLNYKKVGFSVLT